MSDQPNSAAVPTAKKTWLTETIFLAALPVVAHTVAYVYESGYCGYFGIPIEFATISLTSIFVTFSVLVGVALIVWYFIYFGSFFWFEMMRHPVGRTLLGISFFAILFIAQVAIYREDWLEWLPSAFTLWIYGSLSFLIPIVAHRSKPSIRERFEAQEAIDSSVSTLTDYIANVKGGLGAIFLAGILISYFVLTCAYASGRSTAMKETKFLVIKGKPDLAVLRIYGDRMICAPVDVVAHTIRRDFYIRKWDDEKLVLKSRRTGRLELEPDDATLQPDDATLRENPGKP